VKELFSTYAFKTPEIALYLKTPSKVELYECVERGEGQVQHNRPPQKQPISESPNVFIFIFSSYLMGTNMSKTETFLIIVLWWL
jgi:hypothetical protein